MTTPYESAAASIGVTVVTSGAVGEQPGGVAVIALEPALHDHQQGQECIACASRADVRAMLFDLLQEARCGARKPFDRVLIDAHRLADPQAVVQRLDPRSPAIGMRDFTVMRSFHLDAVI